MFSESLWSIENGNVYVNSFFPCAARLWNSLPIECFPLTYDHNGSKSRIIIFLSGFSFTAIHQSQDCKG